MFSYLDIKGICWRPNHGPNILSSACGMQSLAKRRVFIMRSWLFIISGYVYRIDTNICSSRCGIILAPLMGKKHFGQTEKVKKKKRKKEIDEWIIITIFFDIFSEFFHLKRILTSCTSALSCFPNITTNTLRLLLTLTLMQPRLPTYLYLWSWYAHETC